MLEIRELHQRTGEWYDMEEKGTCSGKIYEYEAVLPHSGRRTLLVRLALHKGMVSIQLCEGASLLHDQFYALLGVGHAKAGGHKLPPG